MFEHALRSWFRISYDRKLPRVAHSCLSKRFEAFEAFLEKLDEI